LDDNYLDLQEDKIQWRTSEMDYKDKRKKTQRTWTSGRNKHTRGYNTSEQVNRNSCVN